MMSCKPFSHPNIMPGWSCCKCAASGSGVFNGNNRDACKVCSHERCDNPTVKQIPIRDEGGVFIVPVKTSIPNDKKDIN